MHLRHVVLQLKTPALRRVSAGAALLWVTCGMLLAPNAGAQPKAAPALAAASEKSPVVVRTSPSRPLWRELTTRQQQALQPLAGHWDNLNEAHKRKWLALSRSYGEMSAGDQATLHSRMSAWAGLSNQERTQARFNFAEVKQLPADERKAKWEAYQALSESERHALAARASGPQRGATATARPVPIQKMAPIPATSIKNPQYAPRIQLAPPASAAASPAPLPLAMTPATPLVPAQSLSIDTSNASTAATMPAAAPTLATPFPARNPQGPLVEAP